MVYTLSRWIFIFVSNILFNMKYYGTKNFPKSPFITVANHTSIVDPPLMGIACKKYPLKFVAKKEIFDVPVAHHWASAVGGIRIKRDATDVSSIKAVLKCIKEGNPVCIFPEGTRSMDGELQQPKAGTGFLVAKAKVPVVPVYIRGAFNAWPKGKGPKLRSKIEIFVGKPINLAEFPKDAGTKKEYYQKLSDMVMDSIAEMRDTVPSESL
jgi:1-acyl-sn-glycerol-3-phosphate acyltransferase